MNHGRGWGEASLTPNPSSSTTLMEFYRADDLVGFIREYRRLFGLAPGAIQVWFDMALVDGAYDVDQGDLGANDIGPDDIDIEEEEP